jgi:NTP pyrophosphatase (non-canonical NTP hydrolase)
MLDKEEVQEVVDAYHNGEADLSDLAEAFEDWDGDPFELL